MNGQNSQQFGENFTDQAASALQQAASLAQNQNHTQITGAHLLAALLSDSSGLIRSLLDKQNIDVKTIQSQVDSVLQKEAQSTAQGSSQLALANDLSQVLQRAQKEASTMGDEFVSAEHLLLGLAETAGKARDILNEVGFDAKTIKEVIQSVRGEAKADSKQAEEKYQVLEKYTINLTDQAKNKKLDPVIGRESEIRRVMQVLSRRTKNNPVLIGEAGVGKTAIVEGIAQRIASGEVPEDLESKTVLQLDMAALVAGTKYRGEFEERLKALVDKIKEAPDQYVLFIDEVHTIVGAGATEGSMDASNILKPALARGELRAIGATTTAEYRQYMEKDAALERRFQTVLVKEPSVEDTIAILRGLKDKYEAHHGVRVRDAALVAAAELSDRYITGRNLPDKAIDLIDEATSSLRLDVQSRPEVLENLSRQERRLDVELRALQAERKNKGKKSKDQEAQDLDEKIKNTKKELANIKEKRETLENKWQKERGLIQEVKNLKQKIEDLENQAEIAENQEANLDKVAEIRYGQIPELQKQLEEKQKELSELEKEDRLLKEEVNAEDIARIVSRWTGVPSEKMLKEERGRLALMEDILRERVVGQDHALREISDVIRRSRVGLHEPGRPMGVFLFVGPTGVGKTETAKALAEFLFDDERKLLRLDMSEYSERHSTARLIGSPPGYVGYEEGGQLTEKVRREPYQIILLDEIEKAHPEVYNTLLQLMDEGQLTDGQGRTVDFSNTVVIMTSNLASEKIVEAENMETAEAAIQQALKQHFRPEFLNRLDETVVFRPLGQKQMQNIVDLQLQRVAKRLYKEQGLDLEVGEQVRQMLANQGESREYGARPLQRTIKKVILNPLAKSLLAEDTQEEKQKSKQKAKVFLDEQGETAVEFR